LVPADELSSQLKKYLTKEPVLVAGWLELARIEKSHLASCSIPKIINVFSVAMESINSKRKKVPTVEVETSILGKIIHNYDFSKFLNIPLFRFSFGLWNISSRG